MNGARELHPSDGTPKALQIQALRIVQDYFKENWLVEFESSFIG
jgi:hypothetical protein